MTHHVLRTLRAIQVQSDDTMLTGRSERVLPGLAEGDTLIEIVVIVGHSLPRALLQGLDRRQGHHLRPTRQ